MKAVNIEWDVDCEEDRDFLPTEIELPNNLTDGEIDYDGIEDYLSDVTGFCHRGYELLDEREIQNQEIEAGLEEKKNTKIDYLYRDADNNKVQNKCIIKGVLSDEQKEAIFDSLNDGEYFIPRQVGLPEKRFDKLDFEVDHCWFEMDEAAFSETIEEPTVEISADELVKAFSKCKGNWNDFDFAWMMEFDKEDSEDLVEDLQENIPFEKESLSAQLLAAEGKVREQLNLNISKATKEKER